MKRYTLYAVVFLVVIIATAIYVKPKLSSTALEQNFPKTNPDTNCNWVEKFYTRSQISLWEQNCPTSPYSYNDITYYEGTTSGISVFYDNPVRTRKMIEVFSKRASSTPIETIQEAWYQKLTDAQRKNCEIRETQYEGYKVPLPHITPHKVRYEISIRPEIEKEATNNYQDLPSTTAYDYLCGREVGATFTSFPPYFEFDDRDPVRYLMIHPFWPDGLIRLDPDSIQF